MKRILQAGLAMIALLSWVSLAGAGEVQTVQEIKAAQARFNQMSVKEQIKFLDRALKNADETEQMQSEIDRATAAGAEEAREDAEADEFVGRMESHGFDMTPGGSAQYQWVPPEATPHYYNGAPVIPYNASPRR